MKFGVFVISHGRPNCSTPDILRQSGYSGDIWVICDDEDNTVPEYEKRFGDKLLIFHKDDNFDLGDNFDGPKGVATYARRACANFAKDLQLDCYFEFDDDLQSVVYRYLDNGHIKSKKVSKLDEIIKNSVEYFMSTKLRSFGFALPLDYIGGFDYNGDYSLKRKRPLCCMLQKTNAPLDYVGRHYDDGVGPFLEAERGAAMLNCFDIQFIFDMFDAKGGGNLKGGCHDAYKSVSRYVCWFYGMIFTPRCYSLKFYKNEFHGTFKQSKAFPLLLSESVQK